MTHRSVNLATGIIVVIQLLIFSSATQGQGGEATATTSHDTDSKPPRPVIFSFGGVLPGEFGLESGESDFESGFSVGGIGQIPLGHHVYFGVCLDYQRVRQRTSLLGYSFEIGGDVPVTSKVRVQLGAGSGILYPHGRTEVFGDGNDGGFGQTHLSGRLLFQQPSKIGWTIEFVLWSLLDDLNNYSTIRIGVVF